ncbi:hypothetical protein JOY44_22935 [Phormidium sp. CLA17]|uniref:hypothetical protein n=1 Tax=Leptolyngbya sp. Cla-17 TaxID=2803751 RepID=UPI0014913ABE|nr:hypothetical protein [Leptolyngbya sp. Cla-17]MBM0744431.1 hypothetical protein [Leptolyngbya sp. Cla-17]
MKSQIVATITAFRLSSSIPIALLFGVASLALSIDSRANAVELFEFLPNQTISQLTGMERADLEKPTRAASDFNTQLASPISSQPGQPKSRLDTRKDDQVKVEDAPEGCRAYFPPSGSVSLFDYQQGIKLCKYGR